MKKNGILNSEISKLLSDLGHTDQITIGDAGLPVPDGVMKIDLALKLGTPSFIEVLEEVLKDMVVEKVILAEEIKVDNESQLDAIHQLVDANEVAFVSHEAFKKQSGQSKAIIRTGEATPFSNIILQSNVIF
ncbi:D-ribose pyranase [Carnobacterium sp. PL24RED07]|uniref:D-ribose pyranase n=1 Tax=unclassified Carnobacterium TaxID=257487 RepID=UPI0011EF8E1B|nr:MULTISPECIES: D-ribose pyranase [unclassified Carnobacterium]KAF3299744.1 D-ribose pyranase [Carnobacterium sp. PL26RED25]KAF3304537.1 D-ribose pyranase [Carnobacterium sp. PL24RED07]